MAVLERPNLKYAGPCVLPGALAALTGIVLALAASWALAHYTFDTSFNPRLTPVMILFLLVCLLTVLIGLANSRGLLRRSPLEVLRQEV